MQDHPEWDDLQNYILLIVGAVVVSIILFLGGVCKKLNLFLTFGIFLVYKATSEGLQTLGSFVVGDGGGFISIFILHLDIWYFYRQ